MWMQKIQILLALTIYFQGIPRSSSFSTYIDYAENIEFMEQQVGSNVELHCGLKGLIEETKYPNPKIHWFFKQCIECKHIVSMDDWKRLPCEVDFCKTDLKLRNITDSYSGFYKCTASPYDQDGDHPLEIQLVRLYQLNVKNILSNAPDILDFLPLNKSIIEGASVVFQCKVHSDVYPTIKWFRRLQLGSRSYSANVSQSSESFSAHIVKYKGHVYELLPSTRERAINGNTFLSKLFINRSQLRDEGFYACVAISYQGHRIKEAYLEVQPKEEMEYWADYDSSDEEYTDPKQFWLLFFIPLSLALLPLTLWLCYAYLKKFKINNLEQNFQIEESVDRCMLKK